MATFAERVEDVRAANMRPRAFKRILVHVGRDANSDRRIEIAVELAGRSGGKVIGVYVGKPLVPPVIGMGALPPRFLADEATIDQEDAEAAKRRYLDHLARRDLKAEWHYVREAGMLVLQSISRYMDIVVVGQRDPAVPAAAAVRPEELALGSGRPVLVIPHIGGAISPGRRIVIAWDGGREAARAVSDAFPFLRQASAMWVVSIGTKAPGLCSQSDAAEALCRFLADHGVAAKPDFLQTDECSEADVLLSRITDVGADLLVMGCYGHSRIRELALGGMTREILRHMTVPVLMSH